MNDLETIEGILIWKHKIDLEDRNFFLWGGGSKSLSIHHYFNLSQIR